jgi:signal peptidase I
MDKYARVKKHSKRLWDFFWNDDSIWSWLANIVVAFLLIRFLVYPVLGVVLGTSFPIVAVVSESMEHGLHNNILCGERFDDFQDSYDNYWEVCGSWYEDREITKEQFSKFPFKSGFDKGDVIILWRANKGNVKVGDVLVFQGNKPQPIIHRVVDAWEENDKYYYHTKGDHNKGSIEGPLGETRISESRLLGKGAVRIPYLGWLKILFVDAVRPLGINIQR